MRCSRRGFLALPALAACSRRGAAYRVYALVANQDGHAVAAVDLSTLAVARHIPLGAAPVQVVAAGTRGTAYALTPAGGGVHEIRMDRLQFARKLHVAPTASAMHLAADETLLYVLARASRSLSLVALDTFRVAARVPLPEVAAEFAVTPDGRFAAVSSAESVRLVDLAARQVSPPLGRGDYGVVRFLFDGRTLIAADRGARRLSLYDVASARLITHLPLAVRPDNLCFNYDGGQLFVTGEGMDAVVVVYPYHTPQIAGTTLAGRAPGAMAASESLLFVASAQSGDVSILNIPTRKVIAVVPVGADPGCVAVTPDDQYALVLNRQSGDVAVLRVGTITPNRYKSAAVLTMIPVGSRPVSAAFWAV